MDGVPLLTLLEAAGVSGLLVGGIFALVWFLGKRSWFNVWVRRPFQLVAYSVTLWVFCRLAGLDEAERFAVALVLVFVVGGGVHIGLSFVFTVFFSRRRDIHLPPLLRNVILVATYLAVLLAALKLAVPGFSLSPVLVASGVASLVVGLALQDVLSNLIAGVTLSVERPIRKDDWVQIGGTEGKVVEVTWRTTKLLTRQNYYIIFPNRMVAERELSNLSYPTSLHRHLIEIGLPYATLPSLAEEALVEAAGRVQGVMKRPPPRVLLRGFDASAVRYGLAFATDDYDSLYLTISEIQKEIYYALKRYGIVMPYPTRTVRVRRAEAASTEWMGGYYHRLQVLSGRRVGDRFPLDQDVATLGRGEDCEIDLRDPTASKVHARIVREDGAFHIEDAGSKHGTLVNGNRVEERGRLRSGDEIRIGDTVLRFEEIEFG